jgi:L-rhamnose mutarotase
MEVLPLVLYDDIGSTNLLELLSIAMPRVTIKMKLNKGCEAEYEQRHDQLWPELRDVLKAAGITGYSIFLDPETNDLFGVLTIDDITQLDELPKHPVMQKWWLHMSDIMETNEDHSPATVRLKEVFYLP